GDLSVMAASVGPAPADVTGDRIDAGAGPRGSRAVATAADSRVDSRPWRSLRTSGGPRLPGGCRVLTADGVTDHRSISASRVSGTQVVGHWHRKLTAFQSCR